ncbi:MAG: DNA-binding transcriptional regulator [Akkermansiaceae bacterium]|nr:DNA-binding transcriptional regulator [Akkermansiaceae bacterium]
MSKPKRIAVLVDTSTGWGRRVIRGVANYAFKQPGWQITIEPRGTAEQVSLPEGWQGDGVIARISSKRLYHELRVFGKPGVNVSGIELKGVDMPRVINDYRTSAKLAVGHFANRGFRHLAYCGPDKLSHVARHCAAFEKEAAEGGFSCEVFRRDKGLQNKSWQQTREALVHWLKRLPKPVGVFTWGSERGRSLLNACLEAGISVPEQVAVLGGDDDELLCDTCTPPLSAIVTPAEQAGYEAARILHALMEDKPAPGEDVLLAADEVYTRQSTDILAIEDQDVSRVVNYIRENIQDSSLQVADLADLVGLSRRALERRFNQALGYGPAHEVQTTRNQLVKKLLRETDMSITDVAARAGYASHEYMIRAFKKETGKTPLKYRRWVRAR